jgi:hypothetical protein
MGLPRRALASGHPVPAPGAPVISNASTRMKLPPSFLRPICAVLAFASYYLMLFTDWGSQYHPGSQAGAMILDVITVLASFACWEVFRTERLTPVRAVAAAVGAPLALFATITLCYGLKRHLGG